MSYEQVTFTMSLPRSRTKWMTEVVKPWAVSFHEPLAQHRSVKEFGEWLDGQIGCARPDSPVLIADTVAVFFYRQIIERFPGARFMFLMREPRSVIQSLDNMDPSCKHDQAVYAQADELERARAFARAAGVTNMKFGFVELSHPAGVRKAIQFVTSPRIDWQYCYDMARRPILADHEAAKRTTNPATVRALFASREGAHDCRNH